MKIDNKGFTLVEVLAVIAIITILGIIAVPNVISTIQKSRTASDNLLISNIHSASISLYEELGTGIVLYHYSFEETGVTKKGDIDIDSDSFIEVNLQTLVSNGFLSGTNSDKGKVILNSKNENIGNCNIKITKQTDDANGKITYKVETGNNDNITVSCPDLNE